MIALATCRICGHLANSSRVRCETCGTSDWRLTETVSSLAEFRRRVRFRKSKTIQAHGASLQSMRHPKRSGFRTI